MPNQETAVAVVDQQQQKAIVGIRQALEQRTDDLLAVLPDSMGGTPEKRVERFIRTSLLAISKNADILACTPVSIVRAVIEAAEVGLEPTGSLNRAWLVPFRANQQSPKEAQLVIGYQGYADLMRDSGHVRRITTEVVYDGDVFKVVKGSDEPRIIHEPAYTTEDPTKITHAYAVAWFADGGRQFEVMTKAQIDAIRAKSKQKNGAAWTQGYAQMARKTVLRRLSNYMPLSDRARDAIARDDLREYGSPTPAQASTETRTGSLKERLKGATPKNGPGADETPETAPSSSEESASQQTEPAAATEAEDGEAREICGATSDPALGEVETCVLPPNHLELKGAPKRHQSAAGSIWPAEGAK